MSGSHVGGGPAPAGMPSGMPGDRGTRDFGRVLLALAVVSVGVLYLLQAADVLDAGAVIADWWPLLLIAVGITQVAERSHGVVEPVVWAAAGVTLLAFTTDVLGDDAWAWVWPAFLVVAGAWILLRRAGVRASGTPNAAGDDTLVASGILGGHKVTGTSSAFAGASLTAVLGGVDLDLRQARLAPDGAVVTATAVLGGIDILVPRDWRVAVNGTPILGGIEDAREPREAPPADGPVLRIDAMAVLGGIDVRNEPKS